MVVIALDGFAALAHRPVPPLVQQHLQAVALAEDYALLTLRVHGQEADYLLLRGCAGCATDACVVGCRAALLRRALASTLPGVTPRRVQHALRPRPYLHGLVAWPLRDALPLDRDTLVLADDIAVQVAVRGEGDGIRTAARIALGAAGGNVQAALVRAVSACGWRVIAVPPLLVPVLTKQLYRPPILYGTHAAWGAHLLTSHAHTDASATDDDTLLPTLPIPANVEES